MRKPTLTKGFVAVLCVLFSDGCVKPVSVPPGGGNTSKPAEAKKKPLSDDPMIKEARGELQTLLDGLMTGKFADDSKQGLWVVARKLRSYKSWSLESEGADRDLLQAVSFRCIVEGPPGPASFTVLMVKQQNGKWMPGTMSGPDPLNASGL